LFFNGRTSISSSGLKKEWEIMGTNKRSKINCSLLATLRRLLLLKKAKNKDRLTIYDSSVIF